MRHTTVYKRRNAGFTIIELLIATAVFSLILLVVTGGILAFTRTYTKGINETNTQAAARNILGNISQAVQFSSAVSGFVGPLNNSGSPASQAFCINNTRYSYLLGYEVEDTYNGSLHQSPHALVIDNVASCSPTDNAQDLAAGTLDTGSQELLGPHMRLADLSVVQKTFTSPQTFLITVKVIYGYDDLLVSPTTPAANCVGGDGSEFCASASLSALVEKRL